MGEFEKYPGLAFGDAYEGRCSAAQPQAEASEELARQLEAIKKYRDEYKRYLDGVAEALNNWPEGTRNAYRPDLLPSAVSALRQRCESAEAERDRLKEERDEAKARNVSYNQFVYRLSMKLQSAVRMSGNLEDFVDAACSRLTAAESRAEQLAEALRACSVFVTPQERLRHWDEYKQDAARRIAALAPPAPTTDSKGAADAR